MAKMKFANNANTTLASSLTAIATSMSVTSATKFPVLNPLAPVPEYFYCTLTDVVTNLVIEIVKVTVTTGTTWTITRGQDGTTGTAFAAGDTVSLRLVRASLDDFPKLDEANTFTGVLTASGGVVGNLTGNASTVTTNANLTGPITSVGNATSIASQTGTGTKFVVDTSPTLVTPVLGVATATSINKMAITAPATSSTLAVADGKTLTANKTLTLEGTDSTTMTFPATSATIARTDAAQTFTGTQTFTEIKSANFISTGAVPTVASLTQFDFGVTDFFGSSSTSTKTLFTLPASSSCSGMCFVSAESANGTIFSYIFYFYFSAGVFTATQLAAGSSLGVVTASMALSGADVQISLTYTAGIGGAIRYYASGTANCCNY